MSDDPTPAQERSVRLALELGRARLVVNAARAYVAGDSDEQLVDALTAYDAAALQSLNAGRGLSAQLAEPTCGAFGNHLPHDGVCARCEATL